MTLDQAQEAFRAKPSKRAAGDYLKQLAAYEADDMIGDDTFLDGCREVADWLRQRKVRT